MEKIKIALIDDHPLVRDGFQRLIELDDTFDIVISTDSHEQLLTHLSQSPVDILITDISLEHSNGLTIAKEIKSQFPTIKVIVLSMYESIYYIEQAKALGLEGYVPKSVASTMLISAIESVCAGDAFYHIVDNGKSADDQLAFADYQQLTEREKEIFLNLAKGTAIKRIADELHISPKTVHVHKSKIFEKLNIFDNFSTTRLALKLGLLDTSDL